MQYHDRPPAEGINVTAVHPLRQFVRIVLAVLVLVLLLVVIFRIGGGWLATRLPFHYEQRVMERIDVDFGSHDVAPSLQRYLDALAARLVANMPLPEGMDVTVHYSADTAINAYATLGGNLLFYRGLLAEIPHENALAMVMAHEIAHVLHRDPINGLGGGFASLAALLLVTGNAGSAADVLNTAGGITGVQFTRRMETAADAAAVTAVGRSYGHVDGADALFRRIRERRGNTTPPRWQRFLATHPLDEDRIARIEQQGQREGWALQGELTPLPEDFADWLAGTTR